MMQRFFVVTAALLAMLSAFGDARAARPDEPAAIEPDRAARFFDEARALSDADGGELWGVKLYGPMLFVDRRTRTVTANMSDEDGHLAQTGVIHSGTLPDDVLIANTATDWSGRRWTMLLWPLPEQRYARGKLLAHEMFHRIQDELGLPGGSPENAHLDTRDGRVWLRLEWRALSEALMRTGDDRRTALADALAFRAHRRSLFPQRAEEERELELNEGLAEYTGFRLSGLPEPAMRHRAAVQLEDYDARATFVRNFAYASGPAYGLLLDAAGVRWRANLTSDDDLGELAAAAWNIETAALPEDELRRRAQRYDGWQVFEQEQRRHDQREAKLARFRQRFVDGPILILPASTDVRYSFNPNNVDAFEDRGTVYASILVTDAWGELAVETGGALMIRGEDGRVDRFIVPAPDDADARPLRGDGWTLELADGWSIQRRDQSDEWVLRGP